MKETCTYEGTTPFFFCWECPLFLETCTFVVSSDGYAIGAECGSLYLCSRCKEDCIYILCINQ